jgi:hypothetical protein
MDDGIDRIEGRPRRRWRWPFGWLGLLALGLLVYEMTRQPALAAVAVCLKFGWEDFATARWLWRSDPDRRRGRCCSWLYFAWGLWKTAFVAFLMSVAFAGLTPVQGRPPGGAPDPLLAFAGTFLTALVGFALSTLATAWAVALAWRGGFRLWLDRAVHRARRAGGWPPSDFCAGRTNRLDLLLLTSLGLTLLAALAVLLPVLVAAVPFLSIVLAVCAPVLLVVLREAISERVRAERPAECWGEEDEAFLGAAVAPPGGDAVQ